MYICHIINFIYIFHNVLIYSYSVTLNTTSHLPWWLVMCLFNGYNLFDCLFVWCFWSHSKMFHSFGNVTIAVEGLQILTYARHLWPLSSEGSLACQHLLWHGASVYNGHFEDPWHSHLMLSAFTSCFNDLGLIWIMLEALHEYVQSRILYNMYT